jgi:hypothetical protein
MSRKFHKKLAFHAYFLLLQHLSMQQIIIGALFAIWSKKCFVWEILFLSGVLWIVSKDLISLNIESELVYDRPEWLKRIHILEPN